MVYSPGIVMGTWVGARSPQVHFRNGLGSGSSLALPVAGEVISSVEKQPALNRKYLPAFILPDQATDSFACEPFREKGLKGVIDRTRKPKSKDSTSIKRKKTDKPEKEKKKSKFKRFLENLFGKKKKQKP